MPNSQSAGAGFRVRPLRIERAWRLSFHVPLSWGAWVLLTAFSVAQPTPAVDPPKSCVPKPGAVSTVSFATQVLPVIDRFGCNSISCHGALKGKEGLKFSLFGADADLDFEAVTKSFAGRSINRVEPEQSLFLLKATGAIPHSSYKKIEAGSPEYRVLRDWIAQGAPRSTPGEPQIVSVKAGVTQHILKPGETRQLALTAAFSDGTTRDVTREATVQSTDRKVATVTAGGIVKAGDPGEAIVIVSYLRKADAVRVVVPRPQPATFPVLEAAGKLDELVNAKLKLLGIPPSGGCSDPEFLRRAYLQTIGLLPTPEEARAFLADLNPAKRAKLIDRLLNRDEFADFWALKWGDILRIKSEFPVRVWPKGVETYYRWVRESIAQNKPYDQFARELLTSGGSNFHDGAANFYRALPSKDPMSIGETVALVFMGARLGCAHCHAHPQEDWDMQDDLGMGAFFAKIGYKATLEWKEEIVLFNPKGALRNPRTRALVIPKILGGPTLELDKEVDPRGKFADWLVSPQNPWFTKAIANRIWFWLFKRGIVQEPDDMRPTNPPENPELLNYLAGELASHRYDLKHLYRLILNSRTWQRSSATDPANAGDAVHFSHYPIVRLGAEQLSDAICKVTETSEKFQRIIPEPYTFIPPGHRATQLSDGDIGVPFLELFGRPQRDTPYESERNNDTSLWQALYLLNSDQLENKIASGPRTKRLIAEAKTNEQIVEEYFLAALSRPPSAEEKRKVLEYVAAHKNRGQAIGDVVWALLNTKEFMFVR